MSAILPSLSDRHLRLGVIGTNFISDQLCDAAKQCGITLSAVCSRREETGNAFAKKHGIPAVFCDFEAFCDSDLFDAAYVASPNFCHFPQSKALLEHGKHVLCEKPIVTSERELEILTKIAEKADRVLLEAMRPAYDPALNAIADLLTRCGKLRHARFEYSQYSSRYDRFKSGIMTNAFSPELSNAAVMDIGVYPIHMCVRLFGRPKAVLSRSTKLPNGFEGQGEAILDYGDLSALIVYSKITEASLPSVIRGENGEVQFGKALSKLSDVSFVPKSEAPQKSDFVPTENNMVFELEAFCDCIDRRRDYCAELAVSRDVLFVIDTIRRQNEIFFPSDEV